MIQLSKYPHTNDKIWINPNHIVSMEKQTVTVNRNQSLEYENYTSIFLINNSLFRIAETPEQIDNLIRFSNLQTINSLENPKKYKYCSKE